MRFQTILMLIGGLMIVGFFVVCVLLMWRGYAHYGMAGLAGGAVASVALYAAYRYVRKHT